jgi:hypothetical protein
MIAPLLYFYGLFLVTCGIVSVVFIGPKAKTALASGGTSGLIAIATAYFSRDYPEGAQVAGIVLSLLLFIVFSWRSCKTLFRIFDLIPGQHADLKGKGIAFLIISLMAVVSITILILQLIHYGD